MLKSKQTIVLINVCCDWCEFGVYKNYVSFPFQDEKGYVELLNRVRIDEHTECGLIETNRRNE